MRGVFKMEKNEIVKSEIGSEAAWRGFSTQTLYIAKRLLTAENDDQLYPEQVEDLMIRLNNLIFLHFKNSSHFIILSQFFVPTAPSKWPSDVLQYFPRSDYQKIEAKAYIHLSQTYPNTLFPPPSKP